MYKKTPPLFYWLYPLIAFNPTISNCFVRKVIIPIPPFYWIAFLICLLSKYLHVISRWCIRRIVFKRNLIYDMLLHTILYVKQVDFAILLLNAPPPCRSFKGGHCIVELALACFLNCLPINPFGMIKSNLTNDYLL